MVEMRCVVKKRGVPTYSFAHREGAACPFSVGFRVGFRTRISLRGMKPALVTKVLGSLNQGINWLYPVSDVKSLIGFTAYFGN